MHRAAQGSPTADHGRGSRPVEAKWAENEQIVHRQFQQSDIAAVGVRTAGNFANDVLPLEIDRLRSGARVTAAPVPTVRELLGWAQRF